MQTRATAPEARGYYERGYWRTEDMWSDFDARVRAHPDKLALRCGARMVTYGTLRDAAVALSQRLAADGVAPGDVVALCGCHSIEAVIALLGGLHRGCVLALVPPMFSDDQLRKLTAQCGARALLGFGDEDAIAKCTSLADDVPAVLSVRPDAIDARSAPGSFAAHVPVDSDALAVLLLSSGTTAEPKGVAHSTNTVRYASEQVLARWGLGPDDPLLVVTQFGFVGGLVFGYLPALLAGSTAVLLPRWDAAEALRLVEAHRCAYTLLMPTHAADILFCEDVDRRDLSSLRVMVAAGLTPERRIAMRDRFGLPPLGDYGLSEVPGNAAPAPDAAWEKILHTEGPPFDGTEIRVVGPDGTTPVRTGEPGEVIINGPSRFLGFFGNDELTAASLTDWGGYRTGDVGTLDADGCFTYVGRSKDIIRRGGVTIVPAEIEPVILRHPAVREVALVGVADDRLGERACAALILRPGAEAPDVPELQVFLDGEGVPKYAWPERIEVFDDFPRTSSLKAVKRDIVAAVNARLVSASRA